MLAPIQLRSKIERWQKKARIKGRPIAAKNMSPGVMSYRLQQWGAGANNQKGGGRRKNRFYA